MSARDELYLAHILEAIAAIERFTADGRDGFFANDMVQSAVIRQLEVVGEAVKNLSVELTQREAGIPWKQIAGTRDRIIHGHFRVDLDAVCLPAFGLEGDLVLVAAGDTRGDRIARVDETLHRSRGEIDFSSGIRLLVREGA